MTEKLLLGVPKGSLNDRDDQPDRLSRGNTKSILYKAGFDIRNYEPGKEFKPFINNQPDADQITPALIRPQNGYLLLARGKLDAAIMGYDSFKEGSLNHGTGLVQKVGDLRYGRTRFVVAAPDNRHFGSLTDFFKDIAAKRNHYVLCFSEYPSITSEAFFNNSVYQALYGNRPPFIEINGLRWGSNPQVEILYSAGATEALIELGADIITDSTQSGSALRNYHLREIETIIESYAGLYVGPTCVGWKREKAEEIFNRVIDATS